MSYHIQYPPFFPRKKQGHPGIFPMFCLFLVLTWTRWPEGREVLEALLFPWDREPLRQAAEAFALAVQSGEGLSQAVQTFCRQVIAFAGPY